MSGEDYENLKKYNDIYLEIIMRYKDYIEESERLNVSDLPKLVTPENATVSALCDSIRSGFSNYSYDRNFAKAAVAAFKYVNDKITSVSLPIQFWQSPEETLKRGAGDSFDKVVLLCSMLINLGATDAKVVVAVSGERQKFFVYLNSDNGVAVFDIKGAMKEYKDIRSVLSELNFSESGDSEAYEFNNVLYNDIL